MDREPMIQPLTIEDFKRNPKIQRVKNIVLTLISIQLGLIIVGGLIVITAVAPQNTAHNPYNPQRSMDFGVVVLCFVPIIITAAYYVIFIKAVIEYDRFPLLICTCLNLIGLIIGLIGEYLEFIGEGDKSFSTQHRRSSSNVNIIHIMGLCVITILSVLTIGFALKLAKLIKRPRTNPIV